MAAAKRMTLVFMFIMTLADTGLCGPATAADGQRVQYTCRTGQGEIVDTTYQGVAEDAQAKKAGVFAPREAYGPLEIGPPRPEQVNTNELLFFQEVLLMKLYEAVQGWRPGKSGKVTLVTQDQALVPQEEKVLRLARVKTFPKEIRYAKDVFESMTGAEPLLDEKVNITRELEGRVVALEGDQVVARFNPVSKTPLDGPFGATGVREEGKNYIVEIDVAEGSLVRVGPLVGRIIKVEEKSFVVHYGHAFGGEKLYCDVQLVEGAGATAGKVDGGELPGEKGKSLTVAAVSAELAEAVRKPAATRNQPVAKSQAAAAPELPGVVQKGDMVEVDYTVSLESGEVVATTSRSVAADPRQKKIAGYQPAAHFGPEMVVVGERASVPGLGDALVGMSAGATKMVTLPPQKAYGPRDTRRVSQFGRIRTYTRKMTLTAEEYSKRIKGFPVKGKTVDLNPYIEGEVALVDQDRVILDLRPKTNREENELGATDVQIVGDEIQITLTPKIGAPFQYGKMAGRIVAMDNASFTVDFNPPTAGQNIKLKLAVTSITKASAFSRASITWIEDHTAGLSAAETEEKPMVLVLYADWCSYCKKLMNETLQDPRIKMMGEEFIWVKVNSDKVKELKAQYEQTSFPLTVMFNARGEEVNRIKGYRPAVDFYNELKKVSAQADTSGSRPDKYAALGPAGE